MDTVVQIFAVAVFVAVVLLIEGIYLLWTDRRNSDIRRFEKRLGSFAMLPAEVSAESLVRQRPMSAMPWLDQLLKAVPSVALIDRWLLQSGQSVSVGRFLGISTGAALAGTVIALFLGFHGIVVAGLAAIGACVPGFVIEAARVSRLRKFDEQLPEALDLIARALRSGHAFPSAIQMVGTEGHDPIAAEFRRTFEEINYGIPLDEAMVGLGDRVPSIDLRYFIVAVILQRETGGNLAELLGNLSLLIRERFKLLGRIRVLSAEGKLSGYILAGLPFGTAALIYTMNPGFLSLLWTDPAGPKLIGFAALLMAVGVIWMRRIIRIRV